ncbi:MAG: PD40 domain-containing protein [Bacteroidales bacterium]|nr:PD40 domain-containing protein [Bacteroidales bacterium]
MKKTLLLFVVCTLCLVAKAQDDASQYSRQYEKIYKAYVKEPENVANMLALAEFYADTANPMRDYATAMKYISSAEQRFITILEDRDKYKEVKKLIKKNINLQFLRQTKISITLKAREFLDTEENLSNTTLDNYAEAFKNDLGTTRMIEYRRMEIRYQQTCKENTLAAYKSFINSYPSTAESENCAREMGRLAEQSVAEATRISQVDSMLAGYLDIENVQTVAQRRKSELAYAALMDNPSPQAYRAFLSKYPGSNEYSLVLEKMEQELQSEFDHLSTPRQYADFIHDNPDNPLAENALAKLKQLINDERNMQALKIYLDEFPLDFHYNDIYLKYYNWHTEEGNKAPLEQFASQNPDFPFKIALDDALIAAEKYDSIDIMMPFNEKEFSQWASKVYHLTGKKESYVALQRTLQQLIASKNWGKVHERIEFFSLSFEDNCIEEVAELREIIDRPANSRLTYTPIVRPAYDMMHPVLHPDGQRIFFNREVEKTTSIQSAQWTATKKGGIWKGTGNIAFTNIENRGIEIYNFFNNGNKMLLGKDGDILVAEMSDNGWTVVETLPAPVNSQYNDFDAYMLPSGNGILLASDRPDGMNLQPSRAYFHGDTALASDIYYVPFDGQKWGDAVNLGINVNSPYMECSPVISDDLKTIYFVTDGRGGLGYGDIYYTTRDNIDDWQHWSKPTNYGKEVNSGFNEISITPDGDRQSLTVCSNNHGRYGCYTTPAMHTIDNRMQTITIASEWADMDIDIVDVATQQPVCSAQRIAGGSSWQTSLFADKQYLLFAQNDGLFIPAMLFTPAKNKELTPIAYSNKDLPQMSEEGFSLLLPGIAFDDKKSTLCKSSETEIDHLYQYLASYPYLQLEIIVNVAGDNDAFCYNLSQSRGQEIKKQLVDRGIDADIITVSPYGNSEVKQGKATTSVSIRVFLQ